MKAALFVLCLSLVSFGGVETSSPRATQKQEFLLQSGVTSDKPLLIVFMAGRCPVAAKYVDKLNGLLAEFKEPLGLQILGVFSNTDEGTKSLQAFSQRYSPQFKIILDKRQALADLLLAERTPEAFLFDSGMRLIYRGAIDDQIRVRGTLPNVTRDYVKDLLKALVSSQPLQMTVTDVEGCLISRDDPNAIYPTFTKDIGPLMKKHCTYCHQPGDVGGILPLTDFGTVAGAASTIAERVTDRQMPPWRLDGRYGKFQNDMRLDVNDIWRIRKWVERGKQHGDGDFKLYTADSKSATKHRLTDADVVIPMTEEDAPQKFHTVKKNGVFPYEHFRVRTDFGEDKWLVASEVRAMSPEVIHHINVFLIPPRTDFILENPRVLRLAKAVAKRKFSVDPDEFEWVYRLYGPGMRRQLFLIGNYTPSHTALRFNDDHGVLIPRGSEIVFECHYTANGQETLDRSALAMKFAKTVPANAEGKQSITRAGAPPLGDITLDSGEQKTLSRTFEYFADAKLISLRPHMHLRGKSFRATLERPGEKPETILYVPKWDYEWQIVYNFETPLKLPKGTKLNMIYEWDNSDSNKANPDSKASVRFGTKIHDEMAMAWPTYAYENPREVAEAETLLEASLTASSEVED